MRVDELDFELPEELIAQAPLEERDASRMLVLDRATGGIQHRAVRDLPRELPPSLLVFNDTRVIPARVHGRKESGGRVELLFVTKLRDEGPAELWLALGRASKGLSAGTRVLVEDPSTDLRVVEKRETGEVVVRIEAEGGALAALERLGEMPLPPYIRRSSGAADRERYQTVFAAKPGAVAAPTAGLHFTDRLLGELEAAGHRIARVTLHVGLGTFLPVKVDDLDHHPMHEEVYEVTEEAARAIREARAEGRPVVAVGTTVVRTLESAALDGGLVEPGLGRTRILIQPPYAMRVVDGLVTNFHLPRSTLLALVMAMGGVEPVRAAYAEAVRARYRFFSYGDAMLLRPLPRHR
ncbi:MAG: tRNA preQ1(34) S-adenosylmethionine ribosyltransferase-isomerase QueA [Polyangiales bacterium]